MSTRAIEVFFPAGKPYTENMYSHGSFYSSIWEAGKALWEAFKHADSQNMEILCTTFNVDREVLLSLYNDYAREVCVPSVCCLILGTPVVDILHAVSPYRC